MEPLLSVLNREAKHAAISIGWNVTFYAMAHKTLKWNLRKPQLVKFLKLRSVLDLPQFWTVNHASLRSLHQLIFTSLQLLITSLETMGNISTITSTENLLKAVIGPPKNLRSEFYKDFKENTFSNSQIKIRLWKMA